MGVNSHITRRPRVFLKDKKTTWKTQTEAWSKNINSDPDNAVMKVNEMVQNLDEIFFKCQQKYLDC